MIAVIKTGGKQYKVAPGDKILVEKIEGKEGDPNTFSEVLLLEKDSKVEIGKPMIKDAKVTGKILGQEKGDKIIIFKYKPKKRFQQKKGHRQMLTEVEITGING
jgi:large subunit ribosomal protein L21